MEYNLEWTDEAASDLERIYDYIVWELKNPMAARRTFEKIVKTIESLRQFPQRGDSLFDYFSSHYRFVWANNYRIVYRIQGATVYITRILYKRRDLRNQY